MSYLTKLFFSLKLSKMFYIASIKSFINAFFPNFFITSSFVLLEDLKKELGQIDSENKPTVAEYDKYYKGKPFPHNLYPTDISRINYK